MKLRMDTYVSGRMSYELDLTPEYLADLNQEIREYLDGEGVPEITYDLVLQACQEENSDLDFTGILATEYTLKNVFNDHVTEYQETLGSIIYDSIIDSHIWDNCVDEDLEYLDFKFTNED